MGEISFIHLSDIHFRRTSGNSYDIDSDLRNAVLMDIKYNLKKDVGNVNGILLGGDIAFAGREDEYKIANSFLKEIAVSLGKEECNIFCVPGNHDVNQDITRQSRSVYVAQCDIDSAQNLDEADWLLEKYMLDSSNSNLLYKPVEQYNKFAELYACNIDSKKPIWEKYFELDNNMKLKLVGLNSCIISNHDDHKEKGIDREMIIGQSQIPKYEENIVCVSLCHHPVEFWKFVDVIQDRIDKRIDVQLYGHKHEQAVSKTQERLVINAGATQPTRGKDWRPRYNWVSFECFLKDNDRHIRVKTFPRVLSDDRDRFTPDKDNCDIGKNYFIYEINIDKKRKKNLYDYEQCSCLPKESRIKEINLEEMTKKIGYDFLDLSDVQRLEIMSELQLIHNEYKGKSASQILDFVMADVKKKGYLDKFYKLIKKKQI